MIKNNLNKLHIFKICQKKNEKMTFFHEIESNLNPNIFPPVTKQSAHHISEL